VEGSRAAGPDDIPRIVELARQLRAELGAMKGGVLWTGREALPEPLDASYRALLDRDDACVVVGTIDDIVLGYAAVVVETLRSGQRLGVLTDLFVEPDARAVSIGDSMIADVLAFCRERGCVGVDAIALPGHRATKNFFEAHAFTARALTMHHALDDDATRGGE
jgi:GNAT superfamily N-acetyltransferase